MVGDHMSESTRLCAEEDEVLAVLEDDVFSVPGGFRDLTNTNNNSGCGNN